MIAGKRGELKLPPPQIATVRMDRPHGRRPQSQHAHLHVAGQYVAGQPTPNLDRAAAISRRRASALSQRVVFGINLAASALVGAAITMVLWTDKPTLASLDTTNLETASLGTTSLDTTSLDAVLIDRYEVASRRETTVYRTPPSPEQQARHERPTERQDAESLSSGQPVPNVVPREVKTVTFAAPIQQEPTAGAPTPAPSLAAATPESRAPVTVRAGKTPDVKAPDVKTWRYQLTGVDPQAIAASTADLVVIDYAGSNGPFTRAQVEQMQRKPDGSRRLVLAYMSIGQAETYRWYWAKRSSAWLGAKGRKNYSVRFWHADWQKIIFEYTDKIVAAGFDGVYLDNVDEFEDNGHKDDMAEFVARISSKAKAQRADFMVVPQNGDALLANAKFRRVIDAFAREDLFYGEDANGKRNGASKIRETIRRLKVLKAEGKPVLVVEYPSNDEQAKTARREIAENKFIGLMARRALDRL